MLRSRFAYCRDCHWTTRGRDGSQWTDGILAINDWERLRETATALTDALALIRDCGADAMIEMTPIDRDTGRPAIDHVEAALNAGQHAITANKGPLVHDYRRLHDLAAAKQRAFLFEATVMDGFPLFNLYRECLPTTKVIGFRGVLNSTTNLILTRMEEGMSFDDALRHAQEIGIAETDPSNDVDGLGFGGEGIRAVQRDDECRHQTAASRSCRHSRHHAREDSRGAVRRRKFRLLCSAEWRDDRLVTRVAPEEVAANDPMYRLYGTTSAISIRTDTLNQLTLMETAPTPAQTAFGVLADVIAAARGRF